MSTPEPVPTASEPAPASPYAPAAAAPVEPAAAAPAAAVPLTKQPYFVANLVVLVLSCLVLIGFWADNPVVGALGDFQFPLSAVAPVLAVGLFVTSLVLRAKMKRAGGKQGLAIAVIAVMFVSFFGI